MPRRPYDTGTRPLVRPYARSPTLRPCVCLSECSLLSLCPLISHSQGWPGDRPHGVPAAAAYATLGAHGAAYHTSHVSAAAHAHTISPHHAPASLHAHAGPVPPPLGTHHHGGAATGATSHTHALGMHAAPQGTIGAPYHPTSALHGPPVHHHHHHHPHHSLHHAPPGHYASGAAMPAQSHLAQSTSTQAQPGQQVEGMPNEYPSTTVPQAWSGYPGQPAGEQGEWQPYVSACECERMSLLLHVFVT
jgi:hypothetical protein